MEDRGWLLVRARLAILYLRSSILRNRHNIRHQPALAALIRLGGDDALVDSRVLPQQALDLAKLDPKPADLDLLVGAPNELDLAIGLVARQVASPIKPCCRDGGQWSVVRP